MWSAAIVLALSMLPLPGGDEFRKCLPQSREVAGWVMVDTIRTYDGEALYDFIDGGADVYFEYGFRRAAAAVYSSDSTSKLDVEVYEMNSTESAYGVFSMFALDGLYPLQAGDSAVAGEYSVFIWQENFFVSITSSVPLAPDDPSVLALVKSVELRLPRGGEKPLLADAISSKLVAPSLVYLRGPLVFRSRSSFALRRVPLFTDGVAGKSDNETFVVLRFANEDSCRNGKETFVEQLKLKEFSLSLSGEVATLFNQNGREIQVQAVSRYLVVVEGSDLKGVGLCLKNLVEILAALSE